MATGSVQHRCMLRRCSFRQEAIRGVVVMASKGTRLETERKKLEPSFTEAGGTGLRGHDFEFSRRSERCVRTRRCIRLINEAEVFGTQG
ncbi:hypothetical protein Q8A67_019245 [Cirrhinus molitorella]|uniref:Uncharacterized protein n=1 Tax=Cirrhinus molitorella TaxID=172907 RepID=A0AA88TDI0_9TELE|nr:hypothetical protein Q8A67_019245 [Cirrhinus molitorella]